MSGAFIDCLLAALSEAIGLTAVYGIIAVVAKYGVAFITKKAGELVLKEVLKQTLKKMVPVGLIILLAEIAWHIYWCS